MDSGTLCVSYGKRVSKLITLQLATYLSPAAADGKELNRSGCFGNGDSLLMQNQSTILVDTWDLREVRML